MHVAIRLKELEMRGLVTAAQLQGSKLCFWLLVNLIQTKLKPRRELLLNFQTQQQQSLLAEFQEVAGQTAPYVAFVHQEPYKGKGIRYAVEFVRCVAWCRGNNVERLIFNHSTYFPT